MAHRGSARTRGLGARRGLATLVVGALLVTGLAGCTADEPGPPDPEATSNAALRVTTLPASELDEDTRAGLESEVSDVLADYLAAGFLGDYPRGDFVQAFAGFTDVAAGQAVADIDLLTGSRFAQASAVRATGLEVELSFLVVDGEAVGVTAWVDFEFQADEAGGPTTATLTGRMSLDLRDDRWSVFGYHVLRDDSDALPTEAIS